MVVVHGVLNPQSLAQVVLLERSLTGSVTLPDTTAFDPNDPIATAGGIPIHAATAQITDDSGLVVRGVEDKLAGSGAGTGVYRFNFPSVIRTGARYTLHVTTQEGEIITASTRVPQ